MTNILLFLIIFLSFPNQSLAQQFDSDNYRIEWGNFNMTSGKKSSSNYSLTDTVGQNAPGAYQRNGYQIKSGFQYIYDTFTDFSFSISDYEIDFGSLTPDVATTATNIITITTPSGHGYQILAHQNQPLTNQSGSTIPDTICDSSDCSQSQAGLWVNSSTYGFGFNAQGIGTSNYFQTQDHFRQFADYSANPPEINQIIMSEDSPVTNRSATISYKVNVSTIQPAGKYQNYIIYTAVPKY